jgi:hypothetical protein
VLLLFFLVVVFIDDHDIDAIDGFAKTMPRLHPKPEGECRSVTIVTHKR